MAELSVASVSQNKLLFLKGKGKPRKIGKMICIKAIMIRHYLLFSLVICQAGKQTRSGPHQYYRTNF